MKRICAVVRPTMLEPLKEALFQANVSGMTISQVHVAATSMDGASISVVTRSS